MNGIIATIREHIVTHDAAIGADDAVGIQEPTHLRVIVTAIEVIELRLCVVVISAKSKRVDGDRGTILLPCADETSERVILIDVCDACLAVNHLIQFAVGGVFQLITAVCVTIIHHFGQSVKMVVGVRLIVAVAISQTCQLSVATVVIVRCDISERVRNFCQEGAVLAVDCGGCKLFRRA